MPANPVLPLRRAGPRRLRVAVGLLIALGLSAGAARAQTAGTDCVALTDDAQRLACYDRAHGRSVATPAAATAPAPVAAPAPTVHAPAVKEPSGGNAATAAAGGLSLDPANTPRRHQVDGHPTVDGRDRDR